MAVKLRLKRMGSKKAPFYRIVAADSRYPRDGRFIETLGYYNPLTNPIDLKVNEESTLKWLNNGAIPSDTVKGLLSTAGVLKKFHDNKVANKKPFAKKAPAKKEATTEEVKKPAAKKPATKKTTKKTEE